MMRALATLVTVAAAALTKEEILAKNQMTAEDLVRLSEIIAHEVGETAAEAEGGYPGDADFIEAAKRLGVDENDDETQRMMDSTKEFIQERRRLEQEDQAENLRQLKQMNRMQSLLQVSHGLSYDDKAKLMETRDAEYRSLKSLGIKPTGSEFAGLI